MRFKIYWASLIVGSKFAVFALFYFVFEGNFLSTSSWRAFWRGDLMEFFFLLAVWRAYIWRGLFSESCGISQSLDTFSLGLPLYFQYHKTGLEE